MKINSEIGAVLFCHSSYEERTLAIKKTDVIGTGIRDVYVIHSKGFKGLKEYKDNNKDLIDYLNHKSDGVVYDIEVLSSDSISFIRTNESKIKRSIENAGEVIIDVTTFPRERMILLIDYISRVSSNIKIRVVYFEPKKYASENSSEKCSWLSQGVQRIAPIPGFNGRQNTRKNYMLVIQLGHEGERALMTIKKMEPDKIILIGQNDNQYKKGVQSVYEKQSKSIIDEYGHKLEKIYLVSSHDINASFEVLWRVFELYNSDYNIAVHLNGTKIQVLGAMRYCQTNRNVEIVHSDPQFYNYASYSGGIGHCWQVVI
jgi:hypothetical protein